MLAMRRQRIRRTAFHCKNIWVSAGLATARVPRVSVARALAGAAPAKSKASAKEPPPPAARLVNATRRPRSGTPMLAAYSGKEAVHGALPLGARPVASSPPLLHHVVTHCGRVMLLRCQPQMQTCAKIAASVVLNVLTADAPGLSSVHLLGRRYPLDTQRHPRCSPDSARHVPPSQAGPSAHDASSACARLTRMRRGSVLPGADHEPGPRAPAPPAVPAGPWRRPRVSCAALPAVPEMLCGVAGLGLGLGSRAPTSMQTRAAAANCSSGCGCWRARLNQGRQLTRCP